MSSIRGSVSPSGKIAPDDEDAPESPVERALLSRWQKRFDIGAASELTRRYLHLVTDVVDSHLVPGASPDTLIGEAYVGLMRALCRFDPDGDATFATYATREASAAAKAHASHVRIR